MKSAIFLVALNACSGASTSTPQKSSLAGAGLPIPIASPTVSTPGTEPITVIPSGDGGSINPGGNGGTDGGFHDTRSPANLTISPTQVDFQMQSINSLNHFIFTLQNTGQKPATNLRATGLTAPYSFREGAYPGFRGTCTDTLLGGGSCTLSITYQPSILGRFILNTFAVSYDSENATRVLSVPLDGASTNIASLRFDNLIDDDASYDFGTIAFGVNLTKTIHVRYFGARPATGVTFSGLVAPFSIASNTCGEEVSADCDLVIAYNPTVAGTTLQKLKMTYHNSAYAAEENFTLTAVTSSQVIPATLTISPVGSFGAVLANTLSDKIFSVVRGGTLPATAVSARSFSSSVFTFKGGTYPGEGGTCGSVITGDCLLVLSFSPLSAGNFSSNLTLDFNNGQALATGTVALTGSAATPATLSLSPSAPTDFGSTPLGLAVTKSFTLTHTGGTLPATSINISGLLTPFQNLGGCNSTLAVGTSCTFSIRFNPATQGNYSQLFQVAFNDGMQNQQTGATISAIATDGAVLIPTVSSYNFGSAIAGTPVNATLTFRYYGGQPATGLSFLGIQSPFTFTGGSYPGGGTCGSRISADCSVGVTFTPATAGLAQSNFVLQYDDGTGATGSASVALQGTGIAAVPAVLTFNPTSYNFGSKTINTSTTTTVALNWSGNLSATSLSTSGLSGDFSVLSDTCQGSLSSARTNCNFSIRFLPTQGGSRGPQTLSLSYFNGISTQQATLVLNGTGIDIAVLNTPTANFGSVPLFQSPTANLVFTNSGTHSADSITVGSLAAPFAVVSNGCGASLAPSSSCTIVVSFSPITTGSFSATLPFSYHNGTSTISLSPSLTGTATIGINITVTSGACGTVVMGQTKNVTMTYSNSGTRTATAFAINEASLASPFSLVTNNCNSGSLAGGSSCQVVLRCAPTTAGTFTDTLESSYHNGLTTVAIATPVSVTGSVSITITASAMSFGTIPIQSNLDRTITISNSGTRTATSFTVDNSSLSSPFAVLSTTCGSTLAGGSSCGVTVRYSPLSPITSTGSLRVTYDTGVSVNTLNVAVSGTGSVSITMGVSSGSFGAQPILGDYNINLTLTNSGTRTATALAVNPTSISAPFSYVSDNCGPNLPGGSSCTIVARFSPTTVASFSGNLQIGYETGVGTTAVAAPLTGSGTLSLSINATNAAFGNVPMQSTTDLTVTFANTGTRTATSFQLSTLTAPYSLVSTTCGATLAGNSSCTATVRFNPSVTGTFNSNLTASFQTGVGSATSVSTLIGNSVLSLVIAVNDASYGSLPLFTSADRTLTFTNSGTRTATAFTISTGALSSSYSVVTNSCTSTLAGGASCAVVLRFTPQIAGNINETLNASYHNGMATVNLTSSLTGAGTISITIQATTANFNPITMQGTDEKTVVFSNTGARNATQFSLVASSLNDSGFSILSTNCGTILNAGASCSALVRLTPLRPGIQNTLLQVTYETGVGPASASAALNGTVTIDVLITVNGNHTCARNTLGAVKCWGQNNYGQLGLEDFSNRGNSAGGMGSNLSAVSLGYHRYAKVLTAGYWHNCAILDDNSLKCWGSNSYGQLGLGISQATVGGRSNEMGNNLQTVNLGSGAVPTSLALGYAHSCALLSTGEVKCWGQNSEGQLGLGDSLNRGAQSGEMGNYLPSVDLGGARAIQITANASHTCALLENRTVKCWGNNFFGQLGLGDLENRGDGPNEMGSALPTINLGSASSVQSISAGGAFTCALLQSGQLKCWGRNENGILSRKWCQDVDGNAGLCSNSNYPLNLRGLGLSSSHMGNALLPVDLGTGHTATKITTGDSHVCATLENNKIKCWGANQYGQLGIGSTVEKGILDTDMGNSLQEVDLGTSLTLSSLISGNFHNCALFSNGATKCWGNNRFGGLGLEDMNHRGDEPNEMGSNLSSPAF